MFSEIFDKYFISLSIIFAKNNDIFKKKSERFKEMGNKNWTNNIESARKIKNGIIIRLTIGENREKYPENFVVIGNNAKDISKEIDTIFNISLFGNLFHINKITETEIALIKKL